MRYLTRDTEGVGATVLVWDVARPRMADNGAYDYYRDSEGRFVDYYCKRISDDTAGRLPTDTDGELPELAPGEVVGIPGRPGKYTVKPVGAGRHVKGWRDKVQPGKK